MRNIYLGGKNVRYSCLDIAAVNFKTYSSKEGYHWLREPI